MSDQYFICFGTVNLGTYNPVDIVSKKKSTFCLKPLEKSIWPNKEFYVLQLQCRLYLPIQMTKLFTVLKYSSSYVNNAFIQ